MEERNLPRLPRMHDLTDEEALRFKQALFMTKGKSNNALGAFLAAAGASATEIAKYAANVIIGSKTDKVFQKEHFKYSISARAIARYVKYTTNFWDTTKGKQLVSKYADTLKSLGIDPTEPLPKVAIDREYAMMKREQYQWAAFRSGWCPASMYSCLNDNYGVGKTLNLLPVFAPLSKVKFKEGEYTIEDVITSLVRSSADVNESPSNKKQYEAINYEEYRKWEIDSFVHMDESVTSSFRPMELFIDVIAGDTRHVNFDVPSGIKIQCYIESFYDVCKEMGIVGVLQHDNMYRHYASYATLMGIMKNVIKMSSAYHRLVKKGMAESIARQTVVEEINDNIINRASRPAIRFYARNDYPDTPAEKRAKPAQRKTTKSTGSKNKGILSEDELFAILSDKDTGENNE